MKRVVPLPPLKLAYEMPTIYPKIDHENNDGDNESIQNQSVLKQSNPSADSLPIDCILVYNLTDSHDTKDSETNPNQRKKNKKSSELRQTFEDYLSNNQGVILSRVESTSERIGFVKVHTPFEVLLVTAENMRMRLPIEKIEEHEHDLVNLEQPQSFWHRLLNWSKKQFRLDSSLKQNDPDYYTAIYSSNIERFQKLFDTLRGSRELYFTPSERSLLTYELLSRVHYIRDDEDEEHDQQIMMTTIPPINNTNGENKKIKRRQGIDRLIAKGAYVGFFPLHEPLNDNVRQLDDSALNDREKLKKHWATMRRCLKFQPLSLIRSYMGEKVAFYFAYFGFYNQMLIPAALIGLIIFIYGIGSVFTDEPTSDICGEFGQSTYMCPRCDKSCDYWKLSDSCAYSKISYVFDNAATIVFAILMSLWARWFIEFWKRRKAVLRYDWDSIDFEKHLEPIRPQFENKAKKFDERINPVTDIKEPHVSFRKRLPFFLITAAVVLIMMAIVCVTVFATIAYRVQMDYILKKTSVSKYSSIIITVTSAVMNLICSIILSQFYYWIARKLTDYELHKYQSKYDDSLIIKIYLFQFVNFYSSLFYIAFFKGRFFEYPSKYGEPGSGDFTEQCDPAGCLVELSIQFFIIMVGKQIINNLLEFLTAMRPTLTRICFNRKKLNVENHWEKDNLLFDFTSNTLLDEYLELVIQYGFVTLFVAAFPLAPLFALFNNIIELRLDAWKFLSKYKRPIPFKASDIGIWGDIITAISYLAVLTNAVVIAWTSEFIPKMAYRIIQRTDGSLNGYVNWTLSTFPVSDYQSTNTVPFQNSANLTYCRYRDFREQTGPLYSQTALYWNVTAARLAFIVTFEHLIFFIIYLFQWLIPDVPKPIQNKIDHERYIDLRERWTCKATQDSFKEAAVASEVLSKLMKSSNENDKPSSNRRRNRKKHVRIEVPDEN